MLQQTDPSDYVLATGTTRSVRDFASAAFNAADIDLEWQGCGKDETGICRKSGRTYVKVDPHYYRPTEVDLLQGDASKAQKILGWQPEHSFDQMVAEMVAHDIHTVKRYGQHITEYDDI